MQPYFRILAACAVAAALSATDGAQAQKSGGVLRVHLLDSPPSLSMHEEVDANPARAAMGIFNNLVMFDQHAKQNSMQSIISDLATAWSWSEEGTQLTFQLREGVVWHDGKPFTANDVKCTWDLLTGQSSEKFRLNPRKSWYRNLREVTTNGDYEVTFHLQRPQAALWYPKMYRKDFKIGLNLTGGGVDDPDQQLYENYGCGSPRNYTGYCNHELEKLFERQSAEADEGKRKKLVWEIERKLAEDGARPIIFYNRFAYCWQPQVKNWMMMVNSIINNFRMEDVWLDR